MLKFTRLLQLAWVTQALAHAFKYPPRLLWISPDSPFVPACACNELEEDEEHVAEDHQLSGTVVCFTVVPGYELEGMLTKAVVRVV